MHVFQQSLICLNDKSSVKYNNHVVKRFIVPLFLSYVFSAITVIVMQVVVVVVIIVGDGVVVTIYAAVAGVLVVAIVLVTLLLTLL